MWVSKCGLIQDLVSIEDRNISYNSFLYNSSIRSDRGIIKEGVVADITIFDADQILDQSTFTDPHQYPLGIEFVIINGEIAVKNGDYLAVPAGKVIRKIKPD
jgi:formylmethanofuran dehydrogenase subunit A